MCDNYSDFINDGAQSIGVTHEQFYDFLELFLEVSRKDIESMRHAIAVDDRIAAASAAHSIKGAAISLGLASIAELAEIAEDFSRMGELIEMGTKLEAIAAECDALDGFLQVESNDTFQIGERKELTMVNRDGKP